MDPVHIEKGGDNAQEQVDNCLHRLRQMMLDAQNTFTFDMQGTGAGTVVTTLVVGPKNQPAPKADKPTRDVEIAVKVSKPETAPEPTEVSPEPAPVKKTTPATENAEPSDPEPEAAE